MERFKEEIILSSQSSGVNPSYWKITNLIISKKMKFARITIGCFISEPSNSVKDPLLSKDFIVKDPDFSSYYSNNAPNNFLSQSYQYLKTLEEFNGAIDIDI